MSQEIIIVGSLGAQPTKSDAIRSLIQRDSSIRWDWVQARVDSTISQSDLRNLMNRLRNRGNRRISIVKLPMLDGKTANEIYKICPSVVHPPLTVYTFAQLVDWIFSCDANLIPRTEWYVNFEEAALLALLSKLLRRKYWNKDQSGHKWLRETNLLNQAPVKDPDRGIVRVKALEILPKLKKAGILLTKGTDGGGGTPKEWSINTEFLPKIKKVIIEASFDTLADFESISDLIFSFIESSNVRDINAFDKIINSKTLEVCQDPHNSNENGKEDDEDED